MLKKLWNKEGKKYKEKTKKNRDTRIFPPTTYILLTPDQWNLRPSRLTWPHKTWPSPNNKVKRSPKHLPKQLPFSLIYFFPSFLFLITTLAFFSFLSFLFTFCFLSLFPFTFFHLLFFYFLPFSLSGFHFFPATYL